MASSFVLDPSIHVASHMPRIIVNNPRRQYKDKQYEGGELAWKKKIETSTTIYVGNLSCYTNEFQLYELFGRCGSVKRIIMGLDKNKKTPCGFCFVEFDERQGALASIDYLRGSRLDGRTINVDIDAGFKEGRQYGRGAHGGQVSDEKRQQQEERQAAYNMRGGYGGGNILTRSITVVACLSIITMCLITCMTNEVQAVDKQVKPVVLHSTNINKQRAASTQFLNPIAIRKAQISETRTEFEKAFASFLVNIMKAAKPSLMKAFITASLADKQLREQAIALFFNNTETEERR